MRRSAALLVVLVLFAAARPLPVAASTPTTPVFTLWVDPASAAAFGIWAAFRIAQLMVVGDQVAEHFKEDVRRARDPHVVHPAPILDPLAIRKAS